MQVPIKWQKTETKTGDTSYEHQSRSIIVVVAEIDSVWHTCVYDTSTPSWATMEPLEPHNTRERAFAAAKGYMRRFE